MINDTWIQREQERNTEAKTQVIERIVDAFLQRKLESLAGASGFLANTAHKQGIIENPMPYIQAFDNAHQSQDRAKLADLFKHLTYMELVGIVQMDHVDVPKNLMYQPSDLDANTLDMAALDHFLQSTDTRVALSVSNQTNHNIASFQEIDSSKPFPIHSVGKVFTGALMLKILQEGKQGRQEIISEEDLNKPPQLSESVLNKLPESVKECLKDCTLRDLMTHQSGLGDYLGGYVGKIQLEMEVARKESREPNFPVMKTPHDFLQFAESKIYEMDMVNPISGAKEHYSNLGILLVGLAIEHAYNSKMEPNKRLPYDEILKKFVLEPAKINSFSTHNPGDGIINAEDPLSAHIGGSPAGGYWMNVSDLGKFGQWLVEQCQDKVFLELLKQHGTEFYDSQRDMIVHGGNIPSSSAMLRGYLSTKTAVATLSDRPLLAGNIMPIIEDNAAKDRSKALLSAEPSSKHRHTMTHAYSSLNRSKSMPDLPTPTQTKDKKKEDKRYNPFVTKPKKDN